MKDDDREAPPLDEEPEEDAGIVDGERVLAPEDGRLVSAKLENRKRTAMASAYGRNTNRNYFTVFAATVQQNTSASTPTNYGRRHSAN